jgi:hypothetical protein
MLCTASGWSAPMVIEPIWTGLVAFLGKIKAPFLP